METETEKAAGEQETTTSEEVTEEESKETETGGEETVSLKKHLKVKAELARLKKQAEGDGEETETKKAEVDSDASKIVLEAAKKIQQRELDEAFSKAFEEDVLSLYPELKDKKSAIKALALTEQYKDTNLGDIAVEVFNVAKKSSEDTSGAGGEKTEDLSVDFENMTPEQEAEVMANPEAKKKYYAYLDGKGF